MASSRRNRRRGWLTGLGSLLAITLYAVWSVAMQPPASEPPQGSAPQGPADSTTEPADAGTEPGGAPFDIVYNPSLDGDPDPGEVVWTWVAYEDDPSQGKDRPVLLIGWDGKYLLGLMLTSQDNTRDAADEARWGRYWMDLGTGDWDSKGRPSEVRLDRILRLDPAEVRREGAILDRERFDKVTSSLFELKGW